MHASSFQPEDYFSWEGKDRGGKNWPRMLHAQPRNQLFSPNQYNRKECILSPVCWCSSQCRKYKVSFLQPFIPLGSLIQGFSSRSLSLWKIWSQHCFHFQSKNKKHMCNALKALLYRVQTTLSPPPTAPIQYGRNIFHTNFPSNHRSLLSNRWTSPVLIFFMTIGFSSSLLIIFQISKRQE